MCGIEVLFLCCAAGAAGGCCACRKMHQKGGKKGVKKGVKPKGVKGESETYSRSTKPAVKKENKPLSTGEKKKLFGLGKAKDAPTTKAGDPLKQRPAVTAYEQYALKSQASRQASPELHQRHNRPELPKGGRMDTSDFDRLKKQQAKEKLKGFY